MKNKKIKPYTACFYKKNKTAFAFALLSTVLISLVNLFTAWLLQQMIDSVSGDGNYSPLQLLLMTLGTIAAIVLFKYMSYLSKPQFIRKAVLQYKNLAFSKLCQKSIAAFTHENSASYLSAFSADMIQIENGYLEQLFDLIFMLILMSGSLVMMLLYSPLLSAIAVFLALLPMGAALLAGNRLEAIERIVSDRSGAFLSTLKDILGGFPVVKSFGAEKAMDELFKKSSSSLEDTKYRKSRLSVLLGTLGGIASITAQFGTILSGILLSNSAYPLSPGVLIIFADLTGNVISQLNVLPEILAKRKAALGLIDKLAEALDENIRDNGESIPADTKYDVELKELSFGYGDEAVLNNISTRFEAGKSYAIVGSSGSGKSTLLSLLMGSHSDYSGKILLGEHELRSISSDSLYNIVNLIQQNVFVFNDTVLNNMTLFREFDAEEIESAAERSGLRELVAEKGEAYLCGENGNGLSGGEKQRISIARSLLKKSPILLIDEATSSLDAETAFRVCDSILKLSELTRIVVTHRLEPALLSRYDKIIVLKTGRIAEEGSFAELMENKADFYALYTAAE